ncbi:phytoene desaturase family protein [Acidocella aminolytica]|uniref:FAD dependent oxidoreductase n=1 Tax=Acidocella aminolytica 101 = DSM 11237 TaxID=1120923 RepID=A0A0D6PG66_9PROT|nr:FAD-dependent oxidoreductase [Acidocella aminolytica]GAN79839.1 FAD dependent oxidoreductase [Acidocella aminolytica 101 = DSM 11237]GBQ36580.1 hypothetical protein AA11237_1280 [Acidocella aminolytica 101 = DSM 11237]SHF25999.1 Flavin containing amine oxidoreductase [Acidocella aminolytica 101 = DSM 11237]
MLLEQHDSPGGLATSWQRGDYTFETCLHWLTGVDPKGRLNSRWREVLDIDGLHLVFPEEFARVETEQGECLRIYANVDRLEAELLTKAPEDASEIRHLTSAIRRLAGFPMPDPSEKWPRRGLALLRLLPYLPMLRQWSRVSIQDYGKGFSNPLLRCFFGGDDITQLSMIALLFSLSWMNDCDAAYVVGGGQAIIRAIRQRFEQLGGQLRLGAKVEKILVKQDLTAGVQVVGGEIIAADWVISASDVHATIYQLLDGKYIDRTIENMFRNLKTFPSYLQVSLGVAAPLSE